MHFFLRVFLALFLLLSGLVEAQNTPALKSGKKNSASAQAPASPAAEAPSSETPAPELQPVTTPPEVMRLQDARRQVRVEDSVRDYVVRIARATRQNPEIQLGASPRAALALYSCAQAWAALHGRDYVLPDDVKKVAPPVLCHRLMISPQAQMRGRTAQELVGDLVTRVTVPVET